MDSLKKDQYASINARLLKQDREAREYARQRRESRDQADPFGEYGYATWGPADARAVQANTQADAAAITDRCMQAGTSAAANYVDITSTLSDYAHWSSREMRQLAQQQQLTQQRQNIMSAAAMNNAWSATRDLRKSDFASALEYMMSPQVIIGLDLGTEYPPSTDPAAKSLSERVRELRDAQGRSCDCITDPYFRGLYNGLELALSMIENREPVYAEKPETTASQDGWSPLRGWTPEYASQKKVVGVIASGTYEGDKVSTGTVAGGDALTPRGWEGILQQQQAQNYHLGDDDGLQAGEQQLLPVDMLAGNTNEAMKPEAAPERSPDEFMDAVRAACGGRKKTGVAP